MAKRDKRKIGFINQKIYIELKIFLPRDSPRLRHRVSLGTTPMEGWSAELDTMS